MSELGQSGADKLTVFYAVDRSALYMMAVSIESIRVSIEKRDRPESNLKLRIVVLHSDLAQKLQRILERQFGEFFQLRFHDVGSKFADLNPRATIAKESFFRFLIPELTEEGQSSLYLDSDTMVLRDFRELLARHSQDDSILACLEPNVQKLADLEFKLPSRYGSVSVAQYLEAELGISHHDYLQAGVLLFSRVGPFTRSLMEAAMIWGREKNYWLDDQSLLSKVCAGRFVKIGQEWNKQVGETLWSKRSLNTANILHFSGLFRPWKMWWHPSFALYKSVEERLSQEILSLRPNAGWRVKTFNQIGILSFRGAPRFLKKIIWERWAK